MGNPFSEVLACLFQEFLESGPFKYRLPSNSTYFRCIDDMLIFLPQNIKIKEIAEKLNNVEPSTKFPYEKGSNNTIRFLDILIIKSQNALTFKVYRKLTNKKDYIHFYSYHNNKIKIGVIIGFYLKALRICKVHRSLKYLKFFILNDRKSSKYTLTK